MFWSSVSRGVYRRWSQISSKSPSPEENKGGLPESETWLSGSTVDILLTLQRAHQQHRHGVKIVFINRTTITYNLVSIYTLLEIRAHCERLNNIGMAWGTETEEKNPSLGISEVDSSLNFCVTLVTQLI